MADMPGEVDDWVTSGESTAPTETPVPPPADPTPAPDVPTAAIGDESATTADPLDADADDDESEERERLPNGRFKPKLKRNDPILRINELTRRLRTTENELQQIKAAKAEPAPAKVPDVAPWSEPEPTIEQFADKDDPYGAWQRALAAYDRRHEAHLERVHAAQASVKGQWDQVWKTHQERLATAVQGRPDLVKQLQSVMLPPTPLLDASIMLDNDGVNLALFLASHPGVLAEMNLLTDQRPINESTVAATLQSLREKMRSANNGSVAPSPVFQPAPKPPNPLRTAPMQAGDPSPDGADSLEAHERQFHKRRRL